MPQVDPRSLAAVGSENDHKTMALSAWRRAAAEAGVPDSDVHNPMLWFSRRAFDENLEEGLRHQAATQVVKRILPELRAQELRTPEGAGVEYKITITPHE